MARWKIDPYKMQLEAAIKRDDWEAVENVRSATKRRVMEMIGEGDFTGVELVHDMFAQGFKRVQVGKRVRIESGPAASAIRLAADAETMGMSLNLRTPVNGRDVKERVLSLLENAGNRRPITSSELARETRHRIETIVRAVSQLRDEGRIVSRRVGRHVFHSLVQLSPISKYNLLDEQSNRTDKLALTAPPPEKSVVDREVLSERYPLALNELGSLDFASPSDRKSSASPVSIEKKGVLL